MQKATLGFVLDVYTKQYTFGFFFKVDKQSEVYQKY